jgi:predicted PurR-regulated permease PerM
MHRALAAGPIVWLGIIVTTCLLLVLFQSVLWLVLPVLLAIVSYYLMLPWVIFAMAQGLTRSSSVLMVTVILAAVLLVGGLIVGPKISMAAHNWRNALPEYVLDGTNLVMKAQRTLSNFFPFLHKPPAHPGVGVVTVGSVGSTQVSDEDDALKTNVANLTSEYSGGIALELLHWIPSLLLVPYMTYFFLLDGPRFKRFLVQAIPNAFFEKTLFLFYRVDHQLRRYFQGLLALTALDGVCLGVGLWFLGLNAPFFLAGIAAVLAWLPYLGSIAGCLAVVLVAAHDQPGNTWLPYETVALFIGVRLLDDFIFLPLTVGRSMHMHPLVTVLMILLGGAVAGVAGLLLVMPVLGVVMVAGQLIGELLSDERIMARFEHSRRLRRARARLGLVAPGDAR